MSDFNQQIVTEFRGNAGIVGGPFEGMPMLLLHSTGAKSGEARLTPLVFQPLGEQFAIFASMAGAPNNPAWYHNLVANPDVRAEVGLETINVTARVTAGEERETIWATQKQNTPQFAEYESKTTRVIPVIVLDRRG